MPANVPHLTSSSRVPWIVAAILGIGLVVVLVLKSQDTDRLSGELEIARAQLRTAASAIEKTKKAASEDLSKVRSELGVAEVENTKLKAANKKLKQTARYFFDRATEIMSGSDSNGGDESAIDGYQKVVDRYPDDALATLAKKRIAELRRRIAKRTDKLLRQQGEVRRLIKTCKRLTKAARDARDSGLHFNRYNQLNMNSAMAASRRGNKLAARAEAAKEEANALLADVPDSRGRLAAKVRECDDL